MFVFCAKKREKANINENIEILSFSVLYGKLRFRPQIQLFFQNTYLHDKFCITSLLKSPHSKASRKIWLFPELLLVGIEAYIQLHVKIKKINLNWFVDFYRFGFEGALCLLGNFIPFTQRHQVHI